MRMHRAFVWPAALALALLFAAPAMAAEGSPTPPPPIDWRDFVDDGGTGDYVVGEEMCARPG